MRGRAACLMLALCLVAAAPAGAILREPLFEHWIGFDEDSDFATFLGHGVLMLSEHGPAHPRQARVFAAQSGRPLHVLDCTPIDYEPDDLDLSQPCPLAVATSGRFFVLLGTNAIRVYTRDGELVRDIVAPSGYPPRLFESARNVVVRGRRILFGGPAYDESGRRAPGIAVYTFDALSGALLEQKRIATPDGYVGNVALAFAGRALVASVRGIRAPSEGIVIAVDRRSGAPLWTRIADSQLETELAALGSDVVAGPRKLDGRTGEVEASYDPPPGEPHRRFGSVVASGRRVVLSDGGVRVYAAGGALLDTIEPPEELCDAFGSTVGISASRVLVTSGSYCGSGHAFVYGLR